MPEKNILPEPSETATKEKKMVILKSNEIEHEGYFIEVNSPIEVRNYTSPLQAEQ